MNVHIFEMPLDFGASRHGSDMGPSAMRLAGIKERLEGLGHSVCYSNPAVVSPNDYAEQGNPKAKYLKPIVSSCARLAKELEASVSAREFPLVLGGDHSILLGTLAGLAAAYQKRGIELGVLYADAHGDFNDTQTTPSGNIHGECLASSCGIGLADLTDLYFAGRKVDPHNVCLLGSRDLDSGEKALMKKAGVTVFTMTDIDRQGLPSILRQITGFFKRRVDAVHVSFDMDVLDPMFAPGTGIPLAAGMTNREALLLMEEMQETGMVHSADIVEVNPVLDVRNQTASLAVELAARLLGDKIY